MLLLGIHFLKICILSCNPCLSICPCKVEITGYSPQKSVFGLTFVNETSYVVSLIYPIQNSLNNFQHRTKNSAFPYVSPVLSVLITELTAPSGRAV